MNRSETDGTGYLDAVGDQAMRVLRRWGRFADVTLAAAVFFLSSACHTGPVPTPVTLSAGNAIGSGCRDATFRAALRDGEIDVLERCLESGTNPDIADENGVTPLMDALIEGDAAIAHLLLDHGADPDTPNEYGGSPLSLAIRYDRRFLARRMIDEGADALYDLEDGVAPFVLAACNGNTELVRVMLRDLGDGIGTDDKNAAYLCARNYGRTVTLKFLARHGAEAPPDGPALIEQGFDFVPRNLQEAMQSLDLILSEDDKDAIRTGDAGFGLGHMGLGLWLRNTWGLWGGSRLGQYFDELGVYHPDDMSGIILESYVRYLRDESLRLAEQVARVRAAYERDHQR